MVLVARRKLDILVHDAVASVRTGVEEPMALVDAQGDARMIAFVSLGQLIPVARHELMNDLLALEHEKLGVPSGYRPSRAFAH